MSVIGVRHLPNPVSTLYHLSCAANRTLLGRDNQDQEDKMSLHSGATAFSVDISQKPSSNNQQESNVKVEESERFLTRLSEQNDMCQPPKTFDPDIKTEGGQISQPRRSEECHHSENNIAVEELVHAEHETSSFKMENDDDLADDLSNCDEVTDDTAMSAADGAIDKKKSKRFRLTHNQTRFLMSEFTRQAHPDAAKREKLSREIPGLSPRQVQVWFQNRRAKLKRLTSQDRDRILKSRALPEHFDRSQMLNHAYPSGQSSASGPPHRSSIASSYSKPLAVNTFQRNSTDNYSISPATAAASGYGNYASSPVSTVLSESISPTSNTSNGMTIASSTVSLPGIPGMHQAHPQGYARAHSFSTSYTGSWQQLHTPRIHMSSLDSGIRSDSMVHRPGNTYQEHGGSLSDASSYDRHSSLASSAGQGTQNDGSFQSRLAYQGQSRQPQNEIYPPSSQAVSESHAGFSPANFRQVPPLQTAHLPPPQEYQISPFTPSYNYDSFYQYAQENTSAVSLPASFIRSETSYESPTGYPYDSDMGKFGASYPGDAR